MREPLNISKKLKFRSRLVSTAEGCGTRHSAAAVVDSSLNGVRQSTIREMARRTPDELGRFQRSAAKSSFERIYR